LYYELTNWDWVERQSEITLFYDEIILDLAFRIDLLVEEKSLLK
jgi:hypothetical protein